ncbi:helix-turn-helix transcriptional regulator [Streptacidiphilus sp. P02-A3a]|uniref:helix-turn-helix transcriptional regulator n=1 Tax=Streptacidiphilus sp. P02-A3a TaxID=2704468 RepID=UPI001CDD161E|nr:helix-turn-helix transcriptional regulator [Streptacidiphilus sp. P02-A3a]
MNRTELADFLRRSRERVRPADVGLPEGPRRRTPGLRREEVAQVSGMSADYYMRLEQARSPQPSIQMLSALARALRLSEDGRDHLYLLAGHRPPPGPAAGEEIGPTLRYLLAQMPDTPMQITSDLGDLLAQNPAAEALFGCACTVEGEYRNIAWAWFTRTRTRQAFHPEDWAQASRCHVADLRAAVARRGDAVSAALVRRLLAHSPEFAGLWAEHEVRVRRSTVLRLRHPRVGEVELAAETLLTPAEDQRVQIFTPVPGSGSGEALAALRAIGEAHVGLDTM